MSALTDAFHNLMDWLESFSSDVWFYPIIWAVAFFDSLVPIVPSETTVILGGIAAGAGDLALPLVIGLGAFGAFCGDNFAYWLGRRAGGWLQRTVFRSEKAQGRLEWASEQLSTRGGMLLVTARFIPGGRTAITVSSGITRQPYQRFLKFDALACVIWASYAGSLGYFFGERFDHTQAFLLAFCAALAVSGLIELVRWVRHRSD